MGIVGQQNDTREDNIVLDTSEHEGMCNYKRSHKVFALLRFHSPQKDRPASSVMFSWHHGVLLSQEEKGHLPTHQHRFLSLLRLTRDLAGLLRFKDHNTSCSAVKQWFLHSLSGDVWHKSCTAQQRNNQVSHQMSEVSEIGWDITALISISRSFGKTETVLTVIARYFQYDSFLLRAAKFTCLFKLCLYFSLFLSAPPNAQILSRNRVVWGGRSGQ